MELNVYNESVVINSIVNGLIAVATIWAFWTPFLIVVVVPLMNATFKDVVCEYTNTLQRRFPLSEYLGEVLYNLLQANLISTSELLYVNELIMNIDSAMAVDPTAAEKVIANDQTEINSMNVNMFIIMGITAAAVIVTSIMLAVFLIYKYNLNGHRILAFNIIMALIIVMIEVTFFVGVAAQYVPFDPDTILKDLATKITDYLN
jgi:hypothetical protein